MVSFELNNTQRLVATDANVRNGIASPVQRDVLTTVKSAKRLPSHPWPFCVKSNPVPQLVESGHSSQTSMS